MTLKFNLNFADAFIHLFKGSTERLLCVGVDLGTLSS